MAIVGSERVVREVALALEQFLPAALSALQAEHGDGLVVPMPDGLAERPLTDFLADLVQCEVWAEDVDFTTPAALLSARVLESKVSIRTRIYFRNDDLSEAGAQERRAQRMAAAILRVLRDRPGLASSLDGWTVTEIKRAAVIREDQFADDDSRRVIGCFVDFVVLTRESNSGEGTGPAGWLPSLSLRTL